MAPFDGDRFKELFSDGWRDPSDDLSRASYLVAAGLGVLVGAALIGSAFFTTAAGSGVGVFLLLSLLGTAILVPALFLLVSEWREANKTQMTADRMVAGGFLAGLALAGLGLSVVQYAGGSRRGAHVEDLGHRVDGAAMLAGALVASGAALALLSLLIGLACAFGGGRWTNCEFHVKSVLSRYAVEPDGEYALDHPAPAEDGLQAWISFRGTDGRKYDFRATPEAYADAYAAEGGRLKVERGVIVAIRP